MFVRFCTYFSRFVEKIQGIPQDPLNPISLINIIESMQMVDYYKTAMILTTYVSTMMLRNPYVFKLYCICLFVLIPNNVFSFTAFNSCPSTSFLGSKSSSFLLQSSRRPLPQTKVEESLTSFDPMNFEALDGS